MHKNQIHNTLANRVAVLIAVFSCFVVLAPKVTLAVYQEPANPYPQYDSSQVPELLNGSNVAQTKAGSLWIGRQNATTCPTGTEAGCSRLCLNPPQISGQYPNTSDVGALNSTCVQSWPVLIGLLIDQSTHVRKLAVPTHIESTTVTDSIDNGAASLQANSSVNFFNRTGQLISLLAQTPNTVSGSSTAVPSGIVAEASNSTTFAATFTGRFAVVEDWGYGTAVGHTRQLCLNENTPGGKCITDWSEVVLAADPGIVRLQQLGTAVSRYADPGNTATSGLLVTGALITGSPTAVSNPNVTCGDGMCDVTNNESHAACSADCP